MNQYLQIWDWLLRGVEQLEVFGPKFQQREREYQESTIGNRKSVIGTDEMGSALIYEIFSSASLITLGLYHLVCAIKTHLHHPARDYSAKLYHPFSSSPSSSHRLRHLQLYVIILFLLIAFVHQTLVSSDADPLLKGRTPVHRFSSLQSAAVLFLFLILALAILLSETTSLLPLPSDLFFALASALFYLQFTVSSSAASVQTSDLQAKCDSPWPFWIWSLWFMSCLPWLAHRLDSFYVFFFPYIESAECVALPFHLKQCNPKKLKTFSVYKVSFFVSTPHYILSSPSSLLYNSLFYTCYAG
ncbi:unnamed protein product, partial [Vitis vinifera]